MNLFSNRIVSVIAILIITSQPSLLIAQNVNAEHDSIQSKYSGSPVNPFGETIFVVKARLGPLSVENRAKTITGIIKRLAEDPFFTTDSLLIVHDDNNVDVIYRGQVITTVTENDVRAENKPAEFIAHERHKQISEALNKFIEHNSDAGILKSFIFSGIVLILLILLVYLVNKLHHFIDKRIHQAKAGPLAKIKIRDYQLIPLHRQIRLLHITNVFFRYGLIVLMFFTALWLTSYFLPWTKAYSLIFLGFILEPLKDFLNTLWFFIPNLLTIIVIVFITTLILRFFRFMRTEIEKGAIKISGFYPEWALPVFNIIRFLIWAFSIILIYPHLPGSDSKVFQGMSVFIGLLVSLTSASILGNLVAGFALTFTRAFQIGDRIRVGENVGDVIEKTMAVTKIRTIKNEIITIPNSKIQSSEVVNYSTLAGESGLIIHTTVTIGYDAPWRQVHQLLIDAAKATDQLMLSPEPFVLQNGLDDFYVSYQINAYTRNASKMAVILSDLHKNIQESFNNSGVEIMSPHYRALRDGNRIAMPDDHLPDSYTRPSFGVNLNKE